MVDNFKRLKKLMDFSDSEKFYYLQLLRRSKDGGSKSVKVIKNFYISNEEYFDKKLPFIKEMCIIFKARAYLRMNRRSYEDVAWENLDQMTNLMRNKQHKAVMSSFSKSCGRTNVEKRKIWVVDIDEPFEGLSMNETLQDVEYQITKLQKEVNDDYGVLDIVPTVNGFHILTNPFRVDKFKEVYPEIDIHRDNPTILYANL